MTFSSLLAAGGSGMFSLLLIAFFIFILYFLMIRPQKKREREDQAMRDALCVGDEVTTIGGIIGKVISIKDETFVLETTKAKTRIRFLKGAIRSVDVRITDTLAPKAEDAPKTEDTKAAVEPAPLADEPSEKPKKKKGAKAKADDVAPATVEATPAAEPVAEPVAEEAPATEAEN